MAISNEACPPFFPALFSPVPGHGEISPSPRKVGMEDAVGAFLKPFPGHAVAIVLAPRKMETHESMCSIL
jgi:hypothetical protein